MKLKCLNIVSAVVQKAVVDNFKRSLKASMLRYVFYKNNVLGLIWRGQEFFKMIISILFAFFMLTSNIDRAFAIDYINVHAAGCGSGRSLKDTLTKVNKGSTEYEACADAVDLFRGEVQALPLFVSASCVTFGSYSVDCYLLFIDVCCDLTYMANVHNLTDIVVSHNVITGVPAGAEIAAAEAYFTEFKANAVPPVKEGLVITDVYAGYVYSGNLNSESQLTDVTIDAWKRVGYTGTGVNPIPLDSIASSGGSGGLTVAQTQSAVSGALTEKGLSGPALLQAMKDSFDYADGAGYFDTGGSIGGLNYSDTVDAFNEALNSNHGTFSEFPSFTEPYTKTNPETGFSETYNDFVTTVKASEFYSLSSAFFGSVPQSAGDPPVIAIHGGNTFGEHTFDFSVLSSFLAVIKTCVVLAFCFISVKLLVVNK